MPPEEKSGEVSPRLGISKVATSDREFCNQAVVNFIVECLVQTGGIQGVSADLRRKDLWDLLAPDPYDHLNNAKQTGVLSLATKMTSGQLHAVCESIIDTLEEYQDLEILTLLTYPEAKQLLQSLKPLPM